MLVEGELGFVRIILLFAIVRQLFTHENEIPALGGMFRESRSVSGPLCLRLALALSDWAHSLRQPFVQFLFAFNPAFLRQPPFLIRLGL